MKTETRNMKNEMLNIATATPSMEAATPSMEAAAVIEAAAAPIECEGGTIEAAVDQAAVDQAASSMMLSKKERWKRNTALARQALVPLETDADLPSIHETTKRGAGIISGFCHSLLSAAIDLDHSATQVTDWHFKGGQAYQVAGPMKRIENAENETEAAFACVVNAFLKPLMEKRFWLRVVRYETAKGTSSYYATVTLASKR